MSWSLWKRFRIVVVVTPLTILSAGVHEYM